VLGSEMPSRLPTPAFLLAVITLTCAFGRVRADEPSAEVVVVLRACPALELPDLLDGMSARIPEARFVLDDAQAGLVPWLAEVCTDGTTLVSTLTDTAGGATDTRAMPVPVDAGPEGAERLLAGVLASQIRSARDSWTADADETGALDDADASNDAADEPADRLVPIDFAMSLGLQTIGGLHDRTDEATIALGPALHLGLLVDAGGVVELGIGSLSFVGPSVAATTLNAMPLTVTGGYLFTVGPVALGGLLTVFAEHWTPFGQMAWEGWRGGLGVSGRVVLPIAWLVDLRLDFGVDFFPRAYTFFELIDNTRTIVAELTNWRWRASLALGIRIPVR
jgi:hypothetical protein